MAQQETKPPHLPASPCIARRPKLCCNVILAALLGHCLPCDIVKSVQVEEYNSCFSKTQMQLQSG